MQATIDWCEHNYAVLNFIAEFWNTISGVAIAMSAFYFKYNYSYTFVIQHFKAVYYLLLLTSLGTILFHATLLFPFQLLDEIPMLLLSMVYSNVLRNLYLRTKVDNYWFKIIDKSQIPCYLMMLSIPYIYTIHSKLQILAFHTLLKIYETQIVYMLYNIINKIDTVFFDSLAQEFIINNYLKNRTKLTNCVYKGLLCYATSVSIWCLENLFCSGLHNYQLHAVWHIISSIGIYQLNNILRLLYDIDQDIKRLEN